MPDRWRCREGGSCLWCRCVGNQNNCDRTRQCKIYLLKESYHASMFSRYSTLHNRNLACHLTANMQLHNASSLTRVTQQVSEQMPKKKKEKTCDRDCHMLTCLAICDRDGSRKHGIRERLSPPQIMLSPVCHLWLYISVQ